VSEASFDPPEVARFNPDDHRSYLQLVDFYNYVKNREHLIEEWRGKAKHLDIALKELDRWLAMAENSLESDNDIIRLVGSTIKAVVDCVHLRIKEVKEAEV